MKNQTAKVLALLMVVTSPVWLVLALLAVPFVLIATDMYDSFYTLFVGGGKHG